MNLTMDYNKSTKKYHIIDESGKLLYLCNKEQFSIIDKYVIYDENALQLAELKECLLSKIKYKLYINGSIVDEVKMIKKMPLNQYQLTNNKWVIEGDITYTTYQVFNEDKEKVLEMTCNLAISPNNWTITLLTKTDKILSILVILMITLISKK